MIEVRCISDDDPLEFKLVVRDGKGESRHDVPALAAEILAGKTRGRVVIDL